MLAPVPLPCPANLNRPISRLTTIAKLPQIGQVSQIPTSKSKPFGAYIYLSSINLHGLDDVIRAESVCGTVEIVFAGRYLYGTALGHVFVRPV